MRSAVVLASALILALCAPLHAVEIPNTTVGKTFNEWLAMLDQADDEAVVRTFVETRLAERFIAMGPMDEHIAMARDVAGSLAGFEAAVIESSTDLELAVVGQDNNGEWVRIRMKVQEDPPHRIDGIGIQGADPPGSGPVVAANDDDLVRAVKAYVDSIAAEDRFSGTVLIAHHGETVLEGAWGVASRRYDVPNNVETRFNLGSMNKMFTAVAVAQLVEAGKLDWSDRVGKHLPDYPNPDVREHVSIEHLLTHTSGMGSHFTEEFMESSRLEYREPADYFPLFVDEPLAFEPGTRFSYSNAGFFVLGAIVEALSGETYHDYIRDHIYGPTGMTLTDSYESDGTDPNIATGYYVDDDGTLRDNTLLHSVKGTPAGGGYSTVGDLARFAAALRGGKLVSSVTVALMTSWQQERNPRDGVKRGYGYGFTLRETEDGVRTFGHAGGFPGINGVLDMYPGLDYTVAVLANMDAGAEKVASRIRGMLPRP